MVKYIHLALGIIVFLNLSSCDEVRFTKPQIQSTNELDWSLFPGGDSLAYVAAGYWPNWTANTNSLKNVLIEDFTGLQCNNCPYAAIELKNIEDAHAGRVFGAGIHAGVNGLDPSQQTSSVYTNILYCDEGLEIGEFFGNIPGSSFTGNPHGAVNRNLNGTDNTLGAANWAAETTNQLAEQLKVNLQSTANYFDETNAVFLHVEVDKIDQSLTNDLACVVYVLEDSLIGHQLMPNNTHNSNYIHRDILRGTIDNRTWGRTLASNMLQNGKYYLNYSYKIPSSLNKNNMHFIIYVYDKTTLEIYQVVKQKIQ